MEYLDFESPLKELEDQLAECKLIGDKSEIDVSETCEKLLTKIDITKRDIYNNISPWQRVQLSRHPSRPYTLDYIQALNVCVSLSFNKRFIFRIAWRQEYR